MATGRTSNISTISLLFLCALGAPGCDAASQLENQEYRHYLDRYERWAHGDVAKAFNHLEPQKRQFTCQRELGAAHQARWREKVGPVALKQTPSGTALGQCLDAFHKASGMPEGKLQRSVLDLWVNHNFLPAEQERLDQRVDQDQRLLGKATCGGDQCNLLTVVGDLAVPRVGQEDPVAWVDGRAACGRADFGGLHPWRLPTRGELVAMKESGKLASDPSRATYWSGARHLADDGRIQAWVMRFDVESLGQKAQPKLVSLERDGVPSLAKVRCVHELRPAAVADGRAAGEANPVDRMEKRLTAAGCDRSWAEYVRLRDSLVVTWRDVNPGKQSLRQACRALRWCGLPWSAPKAPILNKIKRDPWFAGRDKPRCVARVP